MVRLVPSQARLLDEHSRGKGSGQEKEQPNGSAEVEGMVVHDAISVKLGWPASLAPKDCLTSEREGRPYKPEALAKREDKDRSLNCMAHTKPGL